MKGFSDHFWQLIDTADLVVVLRDRQRDTQNIRLLEGIFANSWYRHLSRDNYQWYGITQASAMPVTTFVAPGPLVTKTTPTLPVALA